MSTKREHSEKMDKPYEEGAAAARDPDADQRCPYVTETPEADEWQRGYDEARRDIQPGVNDEDA